MATSGVAALDVSALRGDIPWLGCPPLVLLWESFSALSGKCFFSGEEVGEQEETIKFLSKKQCLLNVGDCHMKKNGGAISVNLKLSSGRCRRRRWWYLINGFFDLIFCCRRRCRLPWIWIRRVCVVTESEEGQQIHIFHKDVLYFEWDSSTTRKPFQLKSESESCVLVEQQRDGIGKLLAGWQKETKTVDETWRLVGVALERSRVKAR